MKVSRLVTSASATGSAASRSNSASTSATTSAALSFLVWVEAVSRPPSIRAPTEELAPYDRPRLARISWNSRPFWPDPITALATSNG